MTRDVAILRRIRPAVRRQHARIAEAELRLIDHRAPHVLDQQERQHGLEHRHVDFLALPGALAMEQRHADHRRQHLPGQLVHDHTRDIARRAVGPGVQRGHAAHALDQIVERGMFLLAAALAEAGGARIDQTRVARRQGGIAEAEPFRGAETHVVHEHIGAIDQAQQRIARRGALQVQHHAALVAVEHGEIAAHALVAVRPDPAAVVAVRRFDLDHIGAHVAEHLRGEWPEHDGREIDHPNAGERTALHCQPRSPVSGRRRQAGEAVRPILAAGRPARTRGRPD